MTVSISFKSDIEIAQEAAMKRITKIAAQLDILGFGREPS